jgi:hypothetical protein
MNPRYAQENTVQAVPITVLATDINVACKSPGIWNAEV